MKKRFNVVDVIIVVVSIAAIAFALLRFGAKPSQVIINKNSQKINFVLDVQSIRDYVAEQLVPNDLCIIGNKEKEEATIVSVDSKPAQLMVYNSVDGVYQMQELPEHNDVKLTVEVMAENAENAIRRGEVVFRVGTPISLRTQKYVVSGYVIDVSLPDDRSGSNE